MKSPLADWLKALETTVENGTFVKAGLTKPTPLATDLKSVDIRPILVKRELKLSFTYHHTTRDIVKNYTPEESRKILTKLASDIFLAARLYTLEADLHLAKQGKTFTLISQAPTQKEAPSLAHDKPKQRLIDSNGKAYLHALGLTDESGNVLKSAQDKFRQINKYIEILDGLVKQLPAKGTLRIVDMGSGKGYLTFALYDHLANTLKCKAEVTGVEFRPDMVKLCNTIAQTSSFDGLHFVGGTINDYDCTGTDIVIALHACDTATDDALAKAVKAGASLIVVAPCCHRQIRRQMEPSLGNGKTASPLTFLLRYGSFLERTAEMVTDGLRAQLLELSGYTTNAFEFISTEHTPKNVMITATRNTKPLTASQKESIEAKITEEKKHFGILSHYLETRL